MGPFPARTGFSEVQADGLTREKHSLPELKRSENHLERKVVCADTFEAFLHFVT